MANTLYRSSVQVTLGNLRAVFHGIALLCEHLNSWGLDLVQITRATTGANAGFIVVTINDPIPADQVAHLNLTGPL